MSKRLIMFVLVLAGIVLLISEGLPRFFGDGSSSASPGSLKSQTHYIDGVISTSTPVPIGAFIAMDMSSLSHEQKQFVDFAIQNRGVFRKDDLIVLSLGKGNGNKQVQFLKQETRSDQVVIHIHVVDSQTPSNKGSSSYLIGKMTLPAKMPLSFIDDSTGNLIY